MSHPDGSSENTGMIDLNVLTSAQRSARPTPSLFPSAPAPSLPPSAFAVEVDPTPNRGGKRRRFEALTPFGVPTLGAIVIALATFGAVSAFPTEEPVTPPPVAARPPPAPVSLPEAPPVSTTANDDESTSASAAVPTQGKVGSGNKGWSGNKSFGKGKGVVVAPAPVPAPRKAVDRCGCKGNFDCILRCSSKGK